MQSDIEPAMQAFETNVICGNISMDDYDAELEKLGKMGLDKIADEAAAAYEELSK